MRNRLPLLGWAKPVEWQLLPLGVGALSLPFLLHLLPALSVTVHMLTWREMERGLKRCLQLRSPAALAKDRSSIPSSHIRQFTTPCNSSYKGSIASILLGCFLHSHMRVCAHTHTHTNVWYNNDIISSVNYKLARTTQWDLTKNNKFFLRQRLHFGHGPPLCLD